MIKLEDIEENDIPILLNWLQEKQYIKLVGSSGQVVLRGKLEVKPSSFVEQYTELWSGIPKIGGRQGYYVKQHSKFNGERLEKFFKSFPEVTEQQVLLATKKYIEERKAVGWQFIKKSHKFAWDLNGSELYNYVVNLNEKEESGERYGGI